MNELRELITKIFIVTFLFSFAAFMWVFCTGAANRKKARNVLRNALYSVLYIDGLGAITATVTIWVWVIYDMLKGVCW